MPLKTIKLYDSFVCMCFYFVEKVSVDYYGIRMLKLDKKSMLDSQIESID